MEACVPRSIDFVPCNEKILSRQEEIHLPETDPKKWMEHFLNLDCNKVILNTMLSDVATKCLHNFLKNWRSGMNSCFQHLDTYTFEFVDHSKFLEGISDKTNWLSNGKQIAFDANREIRLKYGYDIKREDGLCLSLVYFAPTDRSILSYSLKVVIWRP